MLFLETYQRIIRKTVLKQFILGISSIVFAPLLYGQNNLNTVSDIENSDLGNFLSSWWFFTIILMIIAFSFYLLFDKTTSFNKSLLKNSKDFNRMRAEELRIYFLFLGFLAPASELFIEYFHLRSYSELTANLLIGFTLIVIYFLSFRNNFFRRHLNIFLLCFFLLFSASTIFKTLTLPFELLTFGELLLVLFFSTYLFQNIRHYWIYVGVVFFVVLSLFSNKLIDTKTAALETVMVAIIVLMNHVKLLVQMNSREKLLFTNAIVNNGKSLVISSDKSGRINFISDNVKEILGYEPEELLGNGWWEKTIDQNTQHENERDKIINLYINEEVTTRMIRTSKGDYRWIQWHDKRFNDNLIVGIGQDVTELRKLELDRLTRHNKIEKQQQIINKLNRLQFNQQKNLQEHIKEILRLAADGIRCDRWNVWEYKDHLLTSQSLYIKSLNTFHKGETLAQEQFPNYFNALKEGKPIIVTDVEIQEETAEFREGYLSNFNIQSLINLPIFIGGKLKLLVCCESCEKIQWDTDDINFVKSISDLISISIENNKRKEAEKKVKESERIYRQINETIDSVFWLYDIMHDKVLYISPSCTAILGADQSYFYSSNDYWKNYVLEQDKKVILEAHDNLISVGKYEIEYRIKKGDEIRWIKEKSFGIKDDNGIIIKSSGICSDITEEKKLREDLQQLSLVAEKTSNGVLITDADARVIWANQGFLDMLEIPFEALIGNRPRDLFLPAEDNHLEVLNGQNFNVELEIMTYKKNRKWISITNTTIKSPNGGAIQQIELITDISERITSRNQIEIQSQKLEEYSKDLEFQNTLKEMLMQTQNIQDVTLNALAFIFIQYENAHHIAMLFPDATEQQLSGYFLQKEQLEREDYDIQDISSYEICKKGEIYICRNIEELEVKSKSDLINLEKGIRSYIILPIIYQQNFLGLLMLGFNSPFNLSEKQIAGLNGSCQIISISIRQIQLQESLQNKTEDLLSSISYAKYIQESILPDLKTFSEHISNVSLLYRPKDLVSGDFYWCKETKTHSFIAVADCTGHGVPGAFLTLLGMNILEQLVGIEQLSDPSEILKKLDRRMFEMLNHSHTDSVISDGMEIALCVFDRQSKQMAYSGAGLGVLYFKDDIEIHIRGQRVSIADARTEEYPFENKVIDITGDEYFFMATDGYQDQLGGSRYKRFSKNSLIQLLNSNKALPPQVQEIVLEKTIEDYMADYPQIDDFTVIGFQIKP